jgi:hypothetical protein
MVIALIVNSEGFPLIYETFHGNRSDVTMMETILHTVERRYAKAPRIWVFAPGIVSEENLAAIRRTRKTVSGGHTGAWGQQVGGRDPSLPFQILPAGLIAVNEQHRLLIRASGITVAVPGRRPRANRQCDPAVVVEIANRTYRPSCLGATWIG